MTNLQINELARLATGRTRELFSDDFQRCHSVLEQEIRDRRILVIGGAGSIGGATIRKMVPFGPRALHVVDQNENGLAELVRDLRSSNDPADLKDLRTLPLNFGGPVMERFLREEAPYDHVLNFAALKHVRSEKDCFSILQMLDTNVVRPAHLLRWLAARGGVRRYFCVSTDKAANPVNLMGASKRLMEHVIFSEATTAGDAGIKVTSSRFANVAFSDGSLLQGWLMRLAKGQPLAVPRDTRRYFVSLPEAGQICLLAAFATPDRHLLVPRLDPSNDLIDLAGLATQVLRQSGYTPQVFETEEEARAAMTNGKANGSYPLLLTPLDTSGEKPYEEFVGEGERSVDLGLTQLSGVAYLPAHAEVLAGFMRRVEEMIDTPGKPASKEQLVEEIQRVLPEFHHIASAKTLDQRL